MRERLTLLGFSAMAGAAVLLTPALVFAHVGQAPATALVGLEGTTRATFEWPSATGPVAGYAVYVSFNGADEVRYSSIIGSNRETVEGSSGGTVQMWVSAFDEVGLEGPRSAASELVQFLEPPPPPAEEPPPPADDNDGLNDGQEVNVHTTDPLDLDTDDDGFSDGEEISGGSDPKDQNSTPPAPYAGSLILHTFANDQAAGTSFPFNQKFFIARPLGARCNADNGGAACGTATLQQGAPLSGGGTLTLDRATSPPSFMLPLSALNSTATGSLPQYSPYQYISTHASGALNESGFFGPGNGPGSYSFTVPGDGGPGARISISRGSKQFGGTMRILGAIGSIRAHEYKNKIFVGTGLASFSVLGGQCPGTACPVPVGSVATASLYYQTAMGKNTTAAITEWGFPWTTGMVTVTATDGPFPTLFRRTGFDNRTPMGLGTIQLVAPQLARWNFPNRDAPWDRHTGAIGILKLSFVPEPSAWLLLGAGLSALAVLYRLQRRR